MRIRIAALTVAIVFASLFVYIGPLGAQFFQPFTGEPPLAINEPSNAEGMGCRLTGVEKYYRSERERLDGTKKWVTTDGYQWTEVWINYLDQGGVNNLNRNLRISESYKFVRFSCGDTHMTIYDPTRLIRLRFNVQDFQIIEIDGRPQDNPRPSFHAEYDHAYFQERR